MGLHLRGHSRARVGDRQHHVMAGADVEVGARKVIVHHHAGGFDHQLAAVGHGILGVHGEVHKDLPHLPGVGAKSSRMRVERQNQIECFHPAAAQHVFVIFDELVHHNGLGLSDLPAAE